nr:cytochrome P450 4C1-like isoform X2 [Onthophagus taurus]
MIEYFGALVAVLTIWCVLKYLRWRNDIYLPLSKIPGPKIYPIIGNLYMFIGVKRSDIFKIFSEMVKTYGPLFRAFSGFIPLINVTKPEHLEQIMSSSIHVHKGMMYEALKEWLGDGLLISNGVKWHQRRKMITPTFHFKILEHFMPVFVKKSKLLIDYLEKESNGNGFDICPYITHCTLDIICETAMGISLNAVSDRNSSYIQATNNTRELFIIRQASILQQTPLYPFLKDGKSFYENVKVLHNFTNKVISERKEYLKEHPIKIEEDDETFTKKRLSFLDLLLTSTEKLTDSDIRAEVDTFMFAGHDTTTTGICWTLFLLGLNQDCQQKAYEEIQDVLGDKNTPETISDLNELKYLECCIKESLRIYPSVPLISRVLTEDITLDGFKIPKGTNCNLDIYHTHRNAEIYPEPEKYDPDRFQPENSKNRHPYAYIPFSAGPRNCIGQKFAMYEEKTLLASILKAYEVISVDKRESINIIPQIVLKSENPFKIALRKRTK